VSIDAAQRATRGPSPVEYGGVVRGHTDKGAATVRQALLALAMSWLTVTVASTAGEKPAPVKDKTLVA